MTALSENDDVHPTLPPVTFEEAMEEILAEDGDVLEALAPLDGPVDDEFGD